MEQSKIDLIAEINSLRTELNAVILAHYYQEPDIQDIADHVGDSLALSHKAAAAEADVIVFAGVHFMAETAKILNPDKQVLLPDLEAGCSLADGCPEDEFREFIAKYPDHKVVSYINCSASTKAMSDIICTSGNAVNVVDPFPEDQPLIFAPDKHLGRWCAQQLDRELVLWDGSCEVHEQFSEQKLIELMLDHPDAVVTAHPECTERLLQYAHHIGSTASILEYCRDCEVQEIIVMTEPGIIHQMQKNNPDKKFITVPGADETCNCNECPYMRLNTLQKLRDCMKNRAPEILVDESTRQKALIPINRMLQIKR